MNNTNDDSIISKTNIIDVNADTFMTEVIEASKEKKSFDGWTSIKLS